MKDLSECRGLIDGIDDRLLELIKERIGIAREIADYKMAHGQPILDKVREQAKLNDLTAKAEKLGLSPLLIRELFTMLMARTVSIEQGYLIEKLSHGGIDRDTSVAYLGPVGTYSHLAAFRFLDPFGGKIDSIECSSFEDIIASVENGRVEYGVLPIENSSSGNINEVLDLMQVTRASIVGELFHPIDHSVLAVDAVPLDEIKEIYSHPQPIAQCSHWLKANLPNVKITYTSSTSESMQKVAERKDRHCAAMGSAGAVRYYPLHPIVTDISNNPNNYTRFIVVSMTPIEVPKPLRAKTSITFSVQKFRPGSLIDVLNAFSSHNINLTKLQSRPLESKNKDTWEEIFFADIEANVSSPEMQDILTKIKPLTESLKILGCYLNGAQERQ